MMAEFRVHRVNFFDFVPKAIHNLAFDEKSEKLALSRFVFNGQIDLGSLHPFNAICGPFVICREHELCLKRFISTVFATLSVTTAQQVRVWFAEHQNIFLSLQV